MTALHNHEPDIEAVLAEVTPATHTARDASNFRNIVEARIDEQAAEIAHPRRGKALFDRPVDQVAKACGIMLDRRLPRRRRRFHHHRTGAWRNQDSAV